MTQRVGKSTNFNDSPIINAGVTINASTSTALLTLTQQDSLLILTNDGNQDAWVKMQAASVDNNKRGFLLYKGTTTELVLDFVRTNVEVSAIARNGNTDIYTTVM